jgi:acyl-homoserine lactone acylase PvdQ
MRPLRPLHRTWLLAALIALGALLAGAFGAVPAGAQVQAYGTNDFGGFRNVLPPGTNGLDNAIQLAQYKATGARPPHNDDQLGMYSNLTTAAPGITAASIGDYFKDATFGVPAGDAESSVSPEPGVTIVRDKAYGVPHIYGDTRAELEFGIGYATAQDRLFFIDALRHAGQANLAQFAGGANVSMDESVWASEPYSPQDLQEQVDYGLTHSPYGQQIYQDASNYIAGINAYIAQAKLNPTLMPAEYPALGKLPEPFSLSDLVSIATLVGGIFGNGGGNQLANAMLYEQLQRKFGREHAVLAGSPELPPKPVAKAARIRSHHRRARHRRGAHRRRGHHRRHGDRSGFATFLSFDAANDPEAPSTVRGRRFPYQTLPRPTRKVLRRVALPDFGSVHFANVVTAGAVPRSAADQPAARRSGTGLLAFPRGMSNALLVNAAHSASGHPLAVMGPQVAYFTPEILMEQDIHGPGIDADGASFPGTNLYVELGHGRDYAWSATSSGQNIIDTFAVPLCNPGGGKVSLQSDYYLLNGRCVAMEALRRSESWSPNLADSTPAGSVTFTTLRTGYGIVIARARIHGRPVAYTNLRSTYMHEVDSVVGFYLFNNPAMMRNARDFMHAAYQIGYTFNWFYTDDKHIAYFDSGLNPVRAPHTDPLFPSWSAYTWRGFHPAAVTTPATLIERQTPQRAHPQALDQTYLTSWNNKQAPGYGDGATGQEFSSVYRSQLLDNNLNHYLAADRGKLTLADVINAMGNAGTQDLRGVEVLPYALAIIGHPRDATLARAAAELRAWVASGAHRINREHPGAHGLYDQSDAVRIMDAWWPLLVRADFGPVLGSQLLGQVEGEFPINDEPGHGTSGEHLGSSWDVGFYGIVQKDLRSALGRRVRGPLNRVYCGRGSLRRCRSALETSLRAAAAEPLSQVYPADGTCPAGDQMCSDSIQFRAIGAISQPLIEWINRPTFQQADEILGHGPR